MKDTTPTTITDEQGHVWTHQPSPLDGEFARTYTCGNRKAMLMSYRNSPQVRLIGKSNQRLATLSLVSLSNPETGGALVALRVGVGA